MVLIVDFFIGGTMILFGRQLTAVFVSGVEQAVIEASYPYLLCCGAMMWVLGLLFVYRFSRKVSATRWCRCSPARWS